MVYYFINVKIAVVRWLSLLTGIPGICNGGFAFVGSMMTDWCLDAGITLVGDGYPLAK